MGIVKSTYIIHGFGVKRDNPQKHLEKSLNHKMRSIINTYYIVLYYIFEMPADKSDYKLSWRFYKAVIVAKPHRILL